MARYILQMVARQQVLRVFWLVVILAGVLFGQPVIQEWKGEWYLRQSVLIPSQDFTRENVEQIARKILDLKAPPAFLQVTFVVDETDARPRPKPDHGSYEGWRRNFEFCRQRSPRVAEVLAIRGSAVLRMRNADGIVNHEVLRGTNPLLLALGKATVELLYFEFSDQRPRKLAHGPVEVGVYGVTTAPLTRSLCSEVKAELEKMLPTKWLSVRLRNDPWFVDDMYFPIFHPFVENVKPPSKSEWEQAPRIGCSHYQK